MTVLLIWPRSFSPIDFTSSCEERDLLAGRVLVIFIPTAWRLLATVVWHHGGPEVKSVNTEGDKRTCKASCSADHAVCYKLQSEIVKSCRERIMSSTCQARKGDIFAAFWLGESRSYQSLSRHKKKVLQQSRKKKGNKRVRNHMSMASVPPRHKKKITQSPASFVPGIQGTPNQHLPPPHTHTHTINSGHTCKPQNNLSLCF